MQTRKLFLCVLFCSVFPMMTGFFQHANFNVKTGLWEQTMVSHSTGAPPSSDDAKAPHTTRMCMSQEKMDRGFAQGDRPGCKQTVVTNTPTVLEVRQECSNPTGKMVVTLHYRALNRETVTGKTHFEMTSGGKTMVSDGTIQGKWVSDSCGDVK
jgi:uncharacterized protein DUF3617